MKLTALTAFKNGAQGEGRAVEYLKKQGYKILETNFRGYQGEIDIVAKDKETLVFVEVKARQTIAYGRPVEYVTNDKIRKIKKTALYYIAKHKLQDADVRFDVVEIFGEEIELIKDAF